MVKQILFWSAEILLLLVGLFLKFIMLPYSFLGLVCLFLAALLGCYGLLFLLVRRYGKPARIARMVLNVCVCIGLIVVTVTEGLVIHASFGQSDIDCDYVIVLGCLVREDGPSVSLQNRIDAAYRYLTDHPDTIAIVTGGQGEDEPMTEAQCMYQCLVAMGIDQSRVWIEDQATSTWENLQYSLTLIEEKTGVHPDTIGLVSSEYHLFRAGLQAKDLGVDTVGIPAKTTLPLDAMNHFLREVAGVWHYILLGGHYD